MKHFKFWKYSLALVPIATTVGLVSCSSIKQGDELYSQNYNTSSNESKEIAKISVSLGFHILTYPDVDHQQTPSETTQSGTGWVFKRTDESTFYMATNLHVANVLTFENQRITDSAPGAYPINYGSIIGYTVKVIDPDVLNSASDNSNFVANQLSEVFVQKPEIVYTTIDDQNYNNTFKDDVYGLYQGNIGTFRPVTDIAILKYNFQNTQDYYSNNYDVYLKAKEAAMNPSNPSEPETGSKSRDEQRSSANLADINNFLEWIKQYSTSTIEVINSFDKYSDDKKYSFRYYMGGFPGVKNYNTTEIVWKSYSDFQLSKTITSQFQYSWNLYSNKNNPNQLSTSISYYVDKDNKNQFISAGKEGYFFAHSDHGASGSPIVAKIDNKLYIVGIYWGTTEFAINQTSRSMGVADFFDNSRNDKKFNLVDAINQKIAQS